MVVIFFFNVKAPIQLIPRRFFFSCQNKCPPLDDRAIRTSECLELIVLELAYDINVLE